MSATVTQARDWTMLARVRDLRVKRRRVLLAQAQQAAQAAEEALAAQYEIQARHAAQLPRLMARCTHVSADAPLWRDALGNHRLREARLSADVIEAQQHCTAALGELHRAAQALRRDLLAFDDARERLRAIAIRRADSNV